MIAFVHFEEACEAQRSFPSNEKHMGEGEK